MFLVVRKFLFTLALLGYITLSVFSLLHLMQMAKMDMPMENCPFATHEHTLCQMSSIEHIRVWQKFLTIPFLFKILLLAGILAVLLYFPQLTRKVLQYLLYIKRERLRDFSLYKQLFREGILNPKAP